MSNVIPLPGVNVSETYGDVPVDGVISGAIEADLASVFILGKTKGGDLYVAMSHAGVPNAIHLFECFKHRFYAGDYE